MKEVIKIIRNELNESIERIKFYKSFVDWKQVYSKEILLLVKKRDELKKALKLLRGVNK